MKKRVGDILIFALSLIALVISLALLRMYGAYEIEYGDGTHVVDGGWFMIFMNILRISALLVLCVLSGIKLRKKSK